MHWGALSMCQRLCRFQRQLRLQLSALSIERAHPHHVRVWGLHSTSH